MGVSISKFHELVTVYKYPHRLRARLKQTLSELHFQNSTRYTTLLWGRTYFFNDVFGKLTGIESLFRGVGVAVIGPFIITCDNSPDKSISNGIADKLMTDIRSTFSLLRCQFMWYSSTASVWFSRCLNLAIYDIFWCTKFFWQPTSTFSANFLPKLCVYSQYPIIEVFQYVVNL